MLDDPDHTIMVPLGDPHDIMNLDVASFHAYSFQRVPTTYLPPNYSILVLRLYRMNKSLFFWTHL